MRNTIHHTNQKESIPINVSVKDNYGNVVASGNYTTAGTYNLSFTPASAGANYTLEFHMTKASAFCFFRVDDVLVSYDDTTTVTVCKEVEDGYRYGFNSMEKDDQVKGRGNSYDFGARMYDSRLGRFLSRDKYALEFPRESPYNYAGNSPILFVDYKGDFKIVITAEAKEALEGANLDTKRFEEIVNDLGNYLSQNDAVMQVIMQQTGFSKDQVLEHVKSGSGPTIFITVNNRGAQAPYSRVDLSNSTITINDGIEIDYTLIQSLANTKDASEINKAALNLILGALVLHEYTHWGDRKQNKGEITGQSDSDAMTRSFNRSTTIPKGKQNTLSKYDHRGLDIEMKMLKTMTSVSGNVSLNEETNERSGGFFYDIQTITNVATKLTLNKDRSTTAGKAKVPDANVLPKDQKP